jgi:hypothetical protein
LTIAAESGRVDAEAVDSLTHLLVGAVMQAGMVVARADDPAAARQLLGESFARLVSTL